ncbi:MAG: hypothetical protein KC468_33240, partial [Myxococcales bacterium]|nr:hypothetical protein [Myxococcales bacterium]
MDPERVDRLLVYAVACAAHHEPPRDELTREHLYKLVYLADLEHARGAGRGAGYTGARWVFGRRGPRCPALADRLDDALARAGAELRPPEPGLRRADAFALAGRELRDRLD